MDKKNNGAKYKQIKEDIVDDILGSVFQPGDVIPTQEEYARRYNVSRLTVRKAFDDLIEKGVLRSEKGRGTYVQEIVNNTYSYRRLSGFTSNVVSKNVNVFSRVLGIYTTKANKRIATKLQTKLGSKILVIERLRYVNDVCTSYHRSHFVHARLSDIDFEQEDLTHNSLYEILRAKAGILPGYLDEYFRAVRATGQIAKYFGMEEGDPVLYVNRVTYDIDNQPIEYCENYESSEVQGVWVKSINI